MRPRKIRVKTEYLIHDVISMIGNVGGTLGLFVGFSFSNVISGILSFLNSCTIRTQNWIEKQNQVTLAKNLHLKDGG